VAATVGFGVATGVVQCAGLVILSIFILLILLPILEAGVTVEDSVTICFCLC